MAFDKTHPARGMADGFGDLLGDGHFIGGEIDIEGDQRLARADHRCAGGAQLRGSKIGCAGRVGVDLGLKPSYCPLRMFSRFCRSGRVAASSYR